MASADIRVERGVVSFGASSDTQAVTFATALGSVSSAFVRITSVTNSSHGPTATTTGTRNNDDLGMMIQSSSISTTGFTLEREPGGANEDVEVFWEVWEYVGPDGGEHEFSVIKRGDGRSNSGTASGTLSVSSLSPSSWDNVTPILGGARSAETGVTYDRARVTLALTKTSGSETLDWALGDGTGVTWFNYVLVDWRGAAWTVENNISKTITTAGTTQTQTVTDVGDWANAFIFSTMRVDLPALDKVGYLLWPDAASTTTLKYQFQASGSAVFTAVVEACIVSSAAISVQHNDSVDGTATAAASADLTRTVSFSEPRADDATAAIGTATCTGTGTAYPRPHWSYRYRNLGTDWVVEFERGRSGQAGDIAAQLIEFNGMSAQAGLTLDESASAATASLAQSADAALLLDEALLDASVAQAIAASASLTVPEMATSGAPTVSLSLTGLSILSGSSSSLSSVAVPADAALILDEAVIGSLADVQTIEYVNSTPAVDVVSVKAEAVTGGAHSIVQSTSQRGAPHTSGARSRRITKSPK